MASFVSGAELININLKDALFSLNEIEGSTKPKLFEYITSCIQTSNEIQNISNFMNMTINRCIEYAKTSKGISIIPNYETFDLNECMQFPISCIESVQTLKSSIEFLEIPQNICSFIITDKLWFQENILCLLSNAIKYSAKKSKVTLSVSLVRRKEERIVRNVSIDNSAGSKSQASVVSFFTFNDYEQVDCMDGFPFLRVEVEDTGIGIDVEKRKGLFTPFNKVQRLSEGYCYYCYYYCYYCCYYYCYYQTPLFEWL